MVDEQLDAEFYKVSQKLKWLINGQFIHCIPSEYWFKLTPERICELYNVEMSYFTLPKNK